MKRKRTTRKKKQYVRINRQIRADRIILIDDTGKNIGQVKTFDALRIAWEKDLDLVEINPNNFPPICKIMDYGKQKYLMHKREQQTMKKQAKVVLKEIKFGPKTEEHDYQFKKKHIEEFLGLGFHVKVTIYFKGRQIAFKQKGYDILNRVKSEFKEIAMVEKFPIFEGRQLFMVIVPTKSPKSSSKLPSKASTEKNKPKKGKVNVDKDKKGSVKENITNESKDKESKTLEDKD